MGSNVVAAFVGVEAGRQILTNRDAYLAAQSPFDRSARLQTDREVSGQEFLTFLGSNVLAWTAADTNRLTPILQAVAGKLAPWRLPFPATIPLVKTTGREEFDFYYTRMNAVVFPADQIATLNDDLLIHELFHVLSRQNPELQARLYAILGFSRINDVTAPAEIELHKVTNPDGIQNGWRITVTNQNQTLQVVPALYIPANISPTRLGNPVGYFRLLEVQNDGATWSPRLVDAKPRLLRVAEVTGYYEQIGRNTGYIIHPDEILADNFVLLINGATNMPTPGIIEGMRKVFAGTGTK